MKISVKVDYACRVLAQLASGRGENQLLRIEDLAGLESVPSNYLVQILNDLRHSGLITSRRGKDGGYMLARPADAISLFDIVRAVDGEVMEFSGTADGHSGHQVRSVWHEIKSALEAKYKTYSLKTLIPAGRDYMYYI